MVGEERDAMLNFVTGEFSVFAVYYVEWRAEREDMETNLIKERGGKTRGYKNGNLVSPAL